MLARLRKAREGGIVRDVPVIVNCRDRVRALRDLVAWLERAGHERVLLLDNDSTYPPLLEFYESTWCEVERLGRNLGYLSPWKSGVVQRFAGMRYVVSDPDVVPDESCPVDAIARMSEALDRFPGAVKAGFSLRIDDIPLGYPHREEVIRWESQFYDRRLPGGAFHAPIDTTFALYREGAGPQPTPAVRLAAPCQARHMPWYEVEETEESRWYFSRTSGGSWGAQPDTTGQATTPFRFRRRVRWWLTTRRELTRAEPSVEPRKD